jgi:ribosomal protein L11 methyltransferase
VNWLQLELRATPDQLETLEEILMVCGAQALTLVSDADEPVLEPAPGETPLWEAVRLQALLPIDVDLANLRRQVEAVSPALFRDAQIEFVGEQDWQARLSNFAVDAVFADRLWLRPKGSDRDDVPADLAALYLEPGLAFGSGSHPTTRLCLTWIAASVRPGMRILDFGCGSGVLAVAAALLGAQVVAVDHDPQAVMATKDNAHYNGVSNLQLQVVDLQGWREGVDADNRSFGDKDFDAVVANILAEPLMQLAPEFEGVLKTGSKVVLSGVLEKQSQAVVRAYINTRFAEPVQLEGWVRLDGVRL